MQDGAGRVGKMLFARQGKKFDYDLKQVLIRFDNLIDALVDSHFLTHFALQLRFAGDLLMELGAGVELATAAVPHLFLPLACAANVVKVVSSSFNTIIAISFRYFCWYSSPLYQLSVCVLHYFITECCSCNINIYSYTDL